MALSKAAAAAARKAAKNRGLQGNRAEDGSMLVHDDIMQQKIQDFIKKSDPTEKGWGDILREKAEATPTKELEAEYKKIVDELIELQKREDAGEEISYGRLEDEYEIILFELSKRPDSKHYRLGESEEVSMPSYDRLGEKE